MKKIIFILFLVLVSISVFFWLNKDNSQENTAELTNTEWVWLYTELQNGNILTAPQGERFVLAFDIKGNVTSLTDCNFISGGYIRDDEVLSFTPFISTKMYCKDSLESEYTKQLALTNSHVIEGRVLKLILNRDFGIMYFAKK